MKAVVAPLLLFVGLRQVSGHAAGLLLNFEAVFTVGLGIVLSGEHLGRRAQSDGEHGAEPDGLHRERGFFPQGLGR
mgnify:CR=1 FL=1